MIVTARFQFDDENAAEKFMRVLDAGDYGELSREIYVEGR